LCRAGRDGGFRTKKGESDPAKTKAMLELWEAAVQRFHDPEVNAATASKLDASQLTPIWLLRCRLGSTL